jgi:hypothetical protein
LHGPAHREPALARLACREHELLGAALAGRVQLVAEGDAPAVGALVLVARQVGGDAVEPGGEVLGLGAAEQALERAQQRLLGQVARGLWVGRKAGQVAVEPGGIGRGQLQACGRVAGLQARGQVAAAARAAPWLPLYAAPGFASGGDGPRSFRLTDASLL